MISPFANEGSSRTASWSAVPEEITLRILECDPDAAPVLGVVSRAFHQICCSFLDLNAKEIIAQYSQGETLLGKLIRTLGANLAPDLHWGCRVSARIHAAIDRQIGFFGVSCARKILIPKEIRWLEGEAQHLQDVNLEKFWKEVRVRIPAHRLNEESVFLTLVDAPADEIRIWMQQNQNVLNSIFNLELVNHRFPELRLTHPPPELGLFGKLVSINLCGNLLGTLSPDTFQGVGQLRNLWLGWNQLRILPPGIFRDLRHLKLLFLAHNQLRELPPVLFQGLCSLRWLHLHDNQLTAFSPRLLSEFSLSGFSLSENPDLLLSIKGFSWHQSMDEVFGTLGQFYMYVPRSRFAKFYQLAASDAAPALLKQEFLRLNPVTKNTLFRKVWEEAGRPETADDRWGEHHLFDDLPVFRRALKKAVLEKFEGLSFERKKDVYAQASILARRGRGSWDADFGEWGPTCMHDHILRLIDAMEAV